MDRTPLLMIPGPIELSPAVLAAAAQPPRSHVSPECIAAFGRSLRAMREVWKAPEGSLPVILAGSGTLAMELAVHNCVSPADRALVVDTGWFSDRMAQMLERRGAVVARIAAEPGRSVSAEGVAAALEHQRFEVVCITHVDTSTGVRTDVEGIARVAKRAGALVIVDGVCSAAGERLDMEGSGVDVFLTASQKAIGAPPGLALAVFSPEAVAAREVLGERPPLGLDLHSWQPILEAYEDGRPSYFATPATSLVAALDVALAEILASEEGALRGVEAAWARHLRVADRLRSEWARLGLELVPESADLAANTLSALRYPEGVGPELVGRIAARGVSVAGGLHPKIRGEYFRVGHMGWVTTQDALLERTVAAIEGALAD